MRVEQAVTPDGCIRYLLLDNQGVPVDIVLRYLKFVDTGFAARNTLRTYCYHLCLFFTYLQERGLDYPAVGIDEMASFVRWLQYSTVQPLVSVQSEPALQRQPARKSRTVNAAVGSVLRFYTYLMIHEDYGIQLSARLTQQLAGSRRPFKDFLYHVSRERSFSVTRLRVPVPKARPKTVPKAAVAALVAHCCNQRDAFLIRLLWESSMRIGEALALWLEDVEIDAYRIHIRDRGDLANGAEIKTTCSPRSLDVSPDLIDAYLAYIADIHTLEVNTNHVFLKLTGPHRLEPMTYADVAALFRRLRRSTGLYVTPHLLRHSSLTLLRRAGWRAEQVMRRAGHAHVQTTIQTYIHPDEDETELRKEWERVQARMRLPQ